MNQDIALGILKSGRNVFLTGSAGTGKTYLLNRYIDYLKERGINPAITAPTGIAASHIGGITIHSFFGIGINENVNKYAIDRLLMKEYLYKRLKRLKVLLVDEISMVSPELFVSLDNILRAFKSSSAPFGGVQLVLSGDFFQLPPVRKEAGELKFAWQTKQWKETDLKVCYLEEKFRQKDDSLVKILDEIRGGKVSEASIKIFRLCYNRKFPGNFQAAKLYTHNKDVDRINKEELDALPGELLRFQAKKMGAKNNIEKIFNSSMVREELELKKGASVVFIKNNFEAGYINGTLGKIIGFKKNSGIPIVEIFSGEKIAAEAEDWKLENDKGEVKALVRQIPLRLAWALTVHKSQGMTLDAAEMDLSKTFELGQGYVALSRIKSISGLRLKGLNGIALQVDKTIIKIDGLMARYSRLNTLKFTSFLDEEKKKMFQEFIIKCGGVVEEAEIEKNRRMSEAGKRAVFAPKEKTIESTKKLLTEGKTVLEIALERGLAADTIFKHIQQIAELWPEIDMSHLAPDQKTMAAVSKAVAELLKNKNPDDFLEDDRLRLKAVFEKLNEEISYDNIRLAMVFMERKKLVN